MAVCPFAEISHFTTASLKLGTAAGNSARQPRHPLLRPRSPTTEQAGRMC